MRELTQAQTEEFLNDSEINYLADLFLSCFDFDRSTKTYRRLRNAVILVSRSVGELKEIASVLSGIEQASPDEILNDVRNAVNSLPDSPHNIFNAHYSLPNARSDGLRMPPYTDPDDVILFLGTAFLYLLIVNYNKYY